MAQAKFIEDVMTISSRYEYSSDQGKTFFNGCSLSHLSNELGARGWKGCSNTQKLATMLQQAGFRCLRAKEKNFPGKKSPTRGREFPVVKVS